MPISPFSAAKDSRTDRLDALLPSWRRSLAARRVSLRTIATYTTSVAQLAARSAAHGMPTDRRG